MGTLAICIDMPPSGELETSGNGASPTQAQMDEELRARQAFLDTVSPYLTALPGRSAQRLGNVSHVELLGRTTWAQLNHYLLLVGVDVANPGIDQALSALLPQGSQVSVAGFFDGVQDWSPSPVNQTLLTTAAPGHNPAPAAEAQAPAAPPAHSAGHPAATGFAAVRTWLISTSERAVFTFMFSFLSALSLSGAFNITAAGVALFAGASTALSVVTAAIRSISPPTDNKGLDVITRTGLTLLQTFTAAFVTTTAGATHFSDWRAGALAGVAATLTTAKGLVAVTANGTNANRATPASLFPLHFGAARNVGLAATPPAVA